MKKLLLLLILSTNALATTMDGNWECSNDVCRLSIFRGWLVRQSMHPLSPLVYVNDERHAWILHD